MFGEATFGKVYAGTFRGAEVDIKVPDLAVVSARAFLNELAFHIKATAAPGIVKVCGAVFDTPETFVLALERWECSLKELLTSPERQGDPSQALKFASNGGGCRTSTTSTSSTGTSTPKQRPGATLAGRMGVRRQRLRSGRRPAPLLHLRDSHPG
jgi:hypothetical protein